MVLAARDGEVLMANAAARAVLAEGEAIDGLGMIDLLPAESAALVRRELDRVARREGGAGQQRGLRIGARHYDLRLAAVPAVGGRERSVVVALIDVTAEREVARLKDEFLSSMSHELRTPLTNIYAFSEILEQVTPENSADWREFVSIVRIESQRLKVLVDDVLDYTALETGQVEWDFEDVDMEQLVSTVVGMHRVLSQKRSIDLQLVVESPSTGAWADRERVRQVLARLLDNALKFTPEGGSVRVELCGAERSVVMTVADSGPGIAPEHRETVFERFRQIGDQLTEKPPGAGLGLALCRKTVRAMGGSIACQDTDLGGVALRVELPSAPMAPAEADAEAAPRPAAAVS